MPTDTKRVRGPEVSQSPTLFLCKHAAVLPSHGPRADGRQRDQVDVRPVFVRCGLVSQAKGSAYIEAGNTKLMCCVYGPREMERKDETDMKCGKLTTDMRFAPFSCLERGSWIQGSQDKDLSLMLHESLQPAVCLHKYPRSQIEVNVMVLENSGLNQISGLQSDGEMTEETLTAGVRTCIEGCYKLYPVIQQALTKAVRRAAPPPSES
ncbi:hypothetical protein CgunFtcFv8_013519 [Champsocephalus gunnari]|uniref:Exoribonuclease phosphorolytic domain-containing protein n=1 Tax=Champsocephalus gunnari TaxID=52237 RepID=A0AAN8DXH0_CHAGU|nr:hypothetical protein CgunFtcFv8_013519 [Champsocephalus gunnari]